MMDCTILLNELIYQLRRNYPDYPSTFGDCSTDGCSNGARGSGKCANCCEIEIALITGMPVEADQFHEMTRRAANLSENLRERLKITGE